jgi:hypothetical protein
MSMNDFSARKNGKKDCYYEWTIGFRKIRVGNCSMEIKGLDDVFQEYFDKEKTPDEIVGFEMINNVRKENFIPEDVEDLYGEALFNEYKVYFNTRKKTVNKTNSNGKIKQKL